MYLLIVRYVRLTVRPLFRPFWGSNLLRVPKWSSTNKAAVTCQRPRCKTMGIIILFLQRMALHTKHHILSNVVHMWDMSYVNNVASGVGEN